MVVAQLRIVDSCRQDSNAAFSDRLTEILNSLVFLLSCLDLDATTKVWPEMQDAVTSLLNCCLNDDALAGAVANCVTIFATIVSPKSNWTDTIVKLIPAAMYILADPDRPNCAEVIALLCNISPFTKDETIYLDILLPGLVYALKNDKTRRVALEALTKRLPRIAGPLFDERFELLSEADKQTFSDTNRKAKKKRKKTDSEKKKKRKKKKKDKKRKSKSAKSTPSASLSTDFVNNFV